MGGHIERMTVLPIGIDDGKDAESMFENVDASHCKCFLESDRQKLLGVVEQGKKFKRNLEFKFKKYK